MASVIEGYQRIFYADALPSVKLTAYALAAAAATFYAGRLIFIRYKDAFADYV
jgi:ABC-type polysaccharide/polyol phosphate export permease